MKIHGIAYMAVGVFVTGFCFLVTNAENRMKFLLFIFFGILLMIVGIVKIVLTYLGEKDLKPSIATTSSHSHHWVRCPGCGAGLRAHDQFCPSCGRGR